jgi:glycosyltransferase involved in cell wall biosynthesis
MEVFCWEKADYILTPSQTIKENLIRLGAEASKIKVIYNGAETPQTFEPLTERPKEYILYFGALQAWQGLETLLKAFTYLQDYEHLRLVICSSNRPKFSKYYLKLIEKLGLEDKIIWHYQLPKRELYQWIREAALTVAPLKECSRNLEQGCCPLKVLESMALATPVIASDLPAVREIIENKELGILARPDRPTELARQIRLLLEHPEQRKLMGQKAQAHILQNFTWEKKQQELTDFYTEILGKTF